MAPFPCFSSWAHRRQSLLCPLPNSWSALVVRLSSLPAIALALLLLVAPAAAQAPDDPGAQGNPPEDPGNGQGNGPPDSPPGWGNGNGNAGGNGNGDADGDDGSAGEPSANQTATQSADAAVRTAACRPLTFVPNFSKSPSSWARVDPDGCYAYMIRRLLEQGA